ncbi:hypothetical protein [Campylobacter hyointestinalis]|nr:hypothetical protein [Campylobacter hyointestinalis]
MNTETIFYVAGFLVVIIFNYFFIVSKDEKAIDRDILSSEFLV